LVSKRYVFIVHCSKFSCGGKAFVFIVHCSKFSKLYK
jgi:hypothetical protein